jgi:hypothetical protein
MPLKDNYSQIYSDFDMFNKKESLDREFISVSALLEIEKRLENNGFVKNKIFLQKNYICGFIDGNSKEGDMIKYRIDFCLPSETRFNFQERELISFKQEEDFYIVAYPTMEFHRFFVFSSDEMRNIIDEHKNGILLKDLIALCKNVLE